MKQHAFLYAIRSGSTSAVKIGITNDVQSRMKKMQTNNPLPLRLVTMIAIPEAANAERHIHQYCARYHIRGEWFDIDHDSDVIALIERAVQTIPVIADLLANIPPELRQFYAKQGNGTSSLADIVDMMIAGGNTEEHFDRLLKRHAADFAKARLAEFRARQEGKNND